MEGKPRLIQLLCMSTSMCILAGGFAAESSNYGPYAQDHVLIKFKGQIFSQLASLPRADALKWLLSNLNLPAGAELKEPIVSQLLQTKAAPATAPAALNLDRFLYVRLPAALSIENAVARLQDHPWVEYVEPDGIGSGGTTIPNDPDFLSQWHHQNSAKPSAAIETPQAWDITQGSSNVLVAVLDSGLSAEQPEFLGRTVPGYNFAYTNSDTMDDEGHGTAVSGALCANTDNSTLVAGVDWHCRLMPVKVLDQENLGLYSWWAQGVDFAVANGCKIINLSAGGSTPSQTLTQSITNAIAHGVIFVTIAHNDGTNVIRFPGSLTDSITVGASDENDQRCTFSNYGPEIDLVAPGTNIYTVSIDGELANWWGTSLAAPLVSGISALLAALRPNITQDEAQALLCLGADDLVGDASDTAGFDEYHGWGRLNAFNSLLLAQTRVDQIKIVTNRTVQLSWPSPANAASKQPYRVDFRTSLDQPWIPLNPALGFTYGTNRTYWLDDGAATGSGYDSPTKFYRVRLREL